MGEMDFYDQASNSETIFIPTRPVQPAKSLDNLRPSDDPIQDTTDYKYQYRHLDRNYYTQKVSKIRPHSSMNRLDNRSVGCPQFVIPSSAQFRISRLYLQITCNETVFRLKHLPVPSKLSKNCQNSIF